MRGARRNRNGGGARSDEYSNIGQRRRKKQKIKKDQLKEHGQTILFSGGKASQ